MENNNDILQKLSSGDQELINEAIQAIKENGDLGIAEALLDYLEKLEDAHLTTLIVSLLADIKENKFREVLIRKIQDTHNPQVKSELLRIVWESALDYSLYLDTFIDMLQNEDFSVAFEASTIIENMVHHLTPEQHHRLHEVFASFPADKQFLIENIHDEMHCCDED